MEIIKVCRRLDTKELISASDGNVSCRTGDGRLLVTPGGVLKGDMEPDDLVLTDMDGNLLEGSRKPSSEIRMHLQVYRNRPDVLGIVHAHPPMIVAFTLAGFPFNAKVLPEVWLMLGNVPLAPYATPSTAKVPESIAPYVEKSRAILLKRHGAVTFGRTVTEACMRMEKLEHAARIIYHASILEERKTPTPLTDNDIRKLEEIRKE